MVEALLMLPMALLWMALFAESVHQLAKRTGGRGSLEKDFTMLAFCQSMPMIACFWLPDILCYVFNVDDARYYRLVRLYGPAAMAWALVLSTAGIATLERISWPKTLLVISLSEVASAITSGTAVLIR
jgi:Yip1-like protein